MAVGDVNARVQHAADILRSGGLVAFPTETVYGLGADARNEAAVRRIFALKGRPADHPVIVHLASAELLDSWAVNVPDVAYALAEAFWPGPLTLILERQAWVSDVVTGGQETVGLRVPSHPVALSLLGRFGGGVAAPSANRFGHVSPTTAAHVRAEFGDVVPVLDGGPCTVGLESTILDLSGRAPKVLRPGAISAAQLEAALRKPLTTPTPDDVAPRVPGGLSSHYAPHTPTFLLESAVSVSHATDAVLARRSQAAEAVRWLTLPDDPDGFGRALYAALRELDVPEYARILIEAVPETAPWAAVRDRLGRAAKPLDILDKGPVVAQPDETEPDTDSDTDLSIQPSVGEAR